MKNLIKTLKEIWAVEELKKAYIIYSWFSFSLQNRIFYCPPGN